MKFLESLNVKTGGGEDGDLSSDSSSDDELKNLKPKQQPA